MSGWAELNERVNLVERLLQSHGEYLERLASSQNQVRLNLGRTMKAMMRVMMVRLPRLEKQQAATGAVVLELIRRGDVFESDLGQLKQRVDRLENGTTPQDP